MCGLGSVGNAEPISAAAAEAERLSAAGEHMRALEALDAATDALWSRAPLDFRTALFVSEAAGFGVYSPRADRAFRAGEAVTVYAEPVGFAYGRSGAFHTIMLGAGLAIRNSTGQVIAEAEELFEVALQSLARNREFNMALSFAMPDLRPGDYVGIFTVRDRNSAKTARFELPFSIVE
ncbi:hypothetical protein ACUN0C_07880 [Faunimonas sp. B44]|uniref:hypothetical protein n=1 Tax=Faunimonas sp. B44 TaxID=3461493 RepID=UPI004044B0C0